LQDSGVNTVDHHMHAAAMEHPHQCLR
jgi:hypothetical protein